MTDTDIGQSLTTDWILVDQAMIDRFADATDDRQFIHVDPVRAAATPFGGTVAHGFLTLSLLSKFHSMLADRLKPPMAMAINYGLDRVRFISPVKAGSRIRATFTLAARDPKGPNRIQQTYSVSVESEEGGNPALIAIWLVQFAT